MAAIVFPMSAEKQAVYRPDHSYQSRRRDLIHYLRLLWGTYCGRSACKSLSHRRHFWGTSARPDSYDPRVVRSRCIYPCVA